MVQRYQPKSLYELFKKGHRSYMHFDYPNASNNNPNFDHLVEPGLTYCLQLATPQDVEAAWKGCRAAIGRWLKRRPPRERRSSDITKKLK